MAKTKPKPAKQKPAAKPAAPAPEAEVRALALAVSRPGVLPIEALVPSPTNPRKTFPEESLKGLADSIRSVGLLQRLVVRPVAVEGHPAPRFDDTIGQWVGVAHFEVIAGERRLRAAKLAGLDKVPVDVRNVSDEQVLLDQLIENDEREDVRPSERAAAYRRLADSGRTAEQIAADTGEPLSAVRALLRLGKLPAWALSAIDAGDLSLTVADLVARVPGAEARRKCAACVMLGFETLRELLPTDIDALDKGSGGCSAPLTFRQTKDLIRNYFTQELKGAPFDHKALYVLAATQSESGRDLPVCESCPNRAGNDPEAAADGGRADVCMDPDCYRLKVKAHDERELLKGTRKGWLAVPEDFSWPHFMKSPPKGWCDIGAPAQLGDLSADFAGSKKGEEKLGDLLKLDRHSPGNGPAVYAAVDQKHKLRGLIKTADARRLLQAAGIIKKPERKREDRPSTDTGSKSAGAATKKPESDKKREPNPIELGDRVGVVAAERCRTMLLANAESLEPLSANGGPDTNAVYQALTLSARALVRDWLEYGFDRREVVVRLIPAANALNKVKDRETADRAIAGMTPAEVVGLIFGLVAHAAATNVEHWGDEFFKEFLDYADTGLAECQEQARRELTGEPATEVKGAKAEAAEPDKVATDSAKPKPPSDAIYLRLISGFPAHAADELAAKKVLTVADLNKLVAKDKSPADHRQKLISAMGPIPGHVAGDAAEAVLDYLHPGRVKDKPGAMAGTPLTSVKDFPAIAGAHLAQHGIRTVEDVAERLKPKGDTTAYNLFRALGVPQEVLYAAGDALVDHETAPKAKAKKGAKAK